MAIILKLKKPEKYCNHQIILVDEHTRTVECEECGQIIDPFDYLHKVASEQLYLHEKYKSMERLVIAKAKELEEIKKAIKKDKRIIRKMMENTVDSR